jgi:hypothetical protein
MIDLLLQNEITPVLIFDGRPLPVKALVDAKRKEYVHI